MASFVRLIKPRTLSGLVKVNKACMSAAALPAPDRSPVIKHTGVSFLFIFQIKLKLVELAVPEGVLTNNCKNSSLCV